MVIRHKAIRLLLAFITLGCVPAVAQSSEPKEEYRSISYKALIQEAEVRYKARVGIELIRCRDGQSISRHREQELMTPASVVKMLSTGAALRERGGNYRFATKIYYTGSISGNTLEGDLNIYGSADPSIGSKHIEMPNKLINEIVYSLQTLGIQRIEGSICLYTGLPEESVPPSWMLEDLHEPYGAGLYGLNYADNTLSLSVSSPRQRGAIKLHEEQPTGIEWKSSLRQSGKGGRITIAHSSGSPQIILRGSLARGERRSLRMSNPSPALTLGHRLSQAMSLSGIELVGQIRSISTQERPRGKLLHTYFSPTLKELCRITNYESQNLYAEGIATLLTEHRHHDKGEALTEYWQRQLSLPQTAMQLRDGSGLSRLNQITPSALALILHNLMGGALPLDGIVVETLPEAGSEGTVRNLSLPYGLKSYLKSGTMRGVCCYAGYIFYQNEWYVLAYMSNGIPSARLSRELLYTLLYSIFHEQTP
ncbi:MAG: D-alanyl-D-alanine carboxypeptidase/D-alanyl-D-alanine-endopeptidase [Porphyromonadaceae bacterium]|nr:D-alanyl-D-alanine carboxypeptidase/D-alanyl-D-alanine-endopeptidase [Porphyromonadaceae bacterium]